MMAGQLTPLPSDTLRQTKRLQGPVTNPGSPSMEAALQGAVWGNSVSCHPLFGVCAVHHTGWQVSEAWQLN